MYYIYMLRCVDNSLHTGITNNIEKRMNDHFNKKGVKYTKSHVPKKLEVLWVTDSKSNASKLEYHIKQLSKEKKEELIKTSNLKIINKVNFEDYKRSNYDTRVFNKQIK